MCIRSVVVKKFDFEKWNLFGVGGKDDLRTVRLFLFYESNMDLSPVFVFIDCKIGLTEDFLTFTEYFYNNPLFLLQTP